MKDYEIFSKRQKQLRGEVPDVYQYEDIPQKLRVQIVHIWKDTLRAISFRSSSKTEFGDAHDAYKAIHNELYREYGRFSLDEDNDFYYPESDNSYYNSDAKSDVESVVEFFLQTDRTEMAIDVIEISFRYIDQMVRDDFNKSMAYEESTPSKVPIFASHDDYVSIYHGISPDEAIDQLNYRFREHGVGYQFESGKIIKMDSQFIHSEAIKPTLIMLSAPMYEGTNEEFLNAHEHYREGRYKECLNECLKAVESCLKTICKKRSWHYDDKRSTAKDLIQIVFDNGLIPSFMQSHFSALKSTLESGLPTVRNRQAAHGQGSTQVIVLEYIAAYALHLTASNILLLANAEEELK